MLLHHSHSKGYQIALNIPAISYNASITGDTATNMYDLINKLLLSLSLFINAYAYKTLIWFIYEKCLIWPKLLPSKRSRKSKAGLFFYNAKVGN